MRLTFLLALAEAMSPSSRLRRVEAAPSEPMKTGYGAPEVTGTIAPKDVTIVPLVEKMFKEYKMSYPADLAPFLQDQMQRKLKKNWGDVSRALKNCQDNGEMNKRMLYGADSEPQKGKYQSKKSWAEQQMADLDAAVNCVRSTFYGATIYYQGNLKEYVNAKLKRNWGQFRNEFDTCRKSAALKSAASQFSGMDAGSTETVRRLYEANTSGKSEAQQNYDNMLFDCTVGRFPKWTQYYQGDPMEYMQASLMTTNWGVVSRYADECKKELAAKATARRLYGAPEESGDAEAKWKQSFNACVQGKLPYSTNMPTNDDKYTTLATYLESKLKVNWGQVAREIGNCQNEMKAAGSSTMRRLYGADEDWETRSKSELAGCVKCVRSKFPPAANFYQGNLSEYVRSRLNVGWGTVRQSLAKCQKMPQMLKLAGRADRRLEEASKDYTSGDASYDKAMVECVHGLHKPWSQYLQGSMPKYLEKLMTTNWGEVSRKFEECKDFDKQGSRQLYGGVEEKQDMNQVEKYMAGLEACVLGKLPFSVKMPKNDDKYLSLGAYLKTKLNANWGTVANKLNECQAEANGKPRATYENADQFKAAQKAVADEMTRCVKSKLPTAATYSQGNVGEYIYSRMRVGWGTWQQNQKACILESQMKAMENRRLYAAVENKEATSATEAYDKALFACIVGKDKYGSQYFQGDAWNYMQSKMKTNWGVVQTKFKECRAEGSRRLASKTSAAEASYMDGMKDCILSKLPFSTKFPIDPKKYTTAESYIKTMMTSSWKDVEPQLASCLARSGAASQAQQNENRRLETWAEKRARRKKEASTRNAARATRNSKRAADRKKAAQKSSMKRAKDTDARTKMEQVVANTADCVIAQHPPGWTFSFDVKNHVKGRMVMNWGQVQGAIKTCKEKVAGSASRRLYEVEDVVKQITECVVNSFPDYTMYYGDLEMYVDSQRRRYNY